MIFPWPVPDGRQSSAFNALINYAHDVATANKTPTKRTPTETSARDDWPACVCVCVCGSLATHRRD